MKHPFIKFVDVKKSFDRNRVLQGVNLSIYKGEITAVIGKSGCGKSVLLKHIIGLIIQDSGEIQIEGRPLSRMDTTARKNFKKKLSYMFQDNALFDSMTVFDNVALPLVEKSSLSREEIHDRVNSRLLQLEIQGAKAKYPAQLSGGMKKRVALARALVTNPDVVLFDEPTTGLDPVRKNGVLSMILDYQRQFGFTGIMVTHEIPDVFDIAQRVAMLEKGLIAFEGSPEEIMNTDISEVRAFINGQDIDTGD